MGMRHIQLCDTRDGTQAVCTLGLHSVHRSTLSSAVLFQKAYCSQKQRCLWHTLAQAGRWYSGPPVPFPPQVAGTLPGSLGTPDDREGANARQEGVKAWPQVTQPGLEPLPPVLRRKFQDFLL